MPILLIEISAFINYLFDIPKGTTELNNTSKIIEHIEMEHLYVCVLFVGSNLNTALDFLQSRKRQFNGSPLIIHYHPSFATVHHNLSQVCIFVPSNHPDFFGSHRSSSNANVCLSVHLCRTKLSRVVNLHLSWSDLNTKGGIRETLESNQRAYKEAFIKRTKQFNYFKLGLTPPPPPLFSGKVEFFLCKLDHI